MPKLLGAFSRGKKIQAGIDHGNTLQCSNKRSSSTSPAVPIICSVEFVN